MTDQQTYTEEEYADFRHLVLLAESEVQSERIEARFEQRKFIERFGRAKCDVMFERMKREG